MNQLLVLAHSRIFHRDYCLIITIAKNYATPNAGILRGMVASTQFHYAKTLTHQNAAAPLGR